MICPYCHKVIFTSLPSLGGMVEFNVSEQEAVKVHPHCGIELSTLHARQPERLRKTWLSKKGRQLSNA